MTDENGEMFLEKVKFYTFSKVRTFLKIWGKSETEGKCIMASEGMDAPDGYCAGVSRRTPQNIQHKTHNDNT